MKGLGKWLRGLPRSYILVFMGAVILFGGGTAVAVWENEEKEALKETIRTFFSAEEEEARTKAWDELVKTGSRDFEFLLWGLENTNSVFMFEQGKLEELLTAIEKSLGGPDGILACCRNAIQSNMTVAKVVAMDVLARHKDLLTAEDAQGLRGVLMNSGEPSFVRVKAAETLASMQAKEAAEDFVSILGNPTETVIEVSTTEEETTSTETIVDVPLALREVCLVHLLAVAPELAAGEMRKVLEDAEAPFRLVKRAVACAVEAGAVELLIERLGKELLAERQAEIAKGLVKLGGETAVAAVNSVVASSQGTTVKGAVLEAVAESKAVGFEEILQGALRSDVKGLRLRAIKAATSIDATEQLTTLLDSVAVIGTPEEKYLLEAVSE